MDGASSGQELATSAVQVADGESWIGDAENRFPDRRQIVDPTAISQFILKGWMPDQPFIDHKTNIVAFGSCSFTEPVGEGRALGPV
jgi:hypothetical protein